MRTTLDFDDRLLREAKKRAAGEGLTLTRLIENALRAYLRPKRGGEARFRLHPLTRKGRSLPGVNLDDRDALYELMEGRS
jgi:hypothetical protein